MLPPHLCTKFFDRGTDIALAFWNGSHSNELALLLLRPQQREARSQRARDTGNYGSAAQFKRGLEGPLHLAKKFLIVHT